ncbi:hypothetical protein [Arthrobacter sp. NPDC090010]|uniref:hypothetical protein n=1 Tax=Arthrobacter sp. NPDC090010 TaxID=3363942 RepID=UPI0038016767
MLTKILRTLVPYFWGIVVTWLLSILPVLEPLRDDLLAQAPVLVLVIGSVMSGLWYVLWEWLRPRLPDWLVRILMGSAKGPVYLARHAASADTQETPTLVDHSESGARHLAREGEE